MGKRKSKAKIMKAPPPKVERVFDCPFCCRTKTVEVKMQRPQKKATLMCRICKETYEFSITSLMLEVDVFCKWIDECSRINEPAIEGGVEKAKVEKLGFTDKGPKKEKTPFANALSSDEDSDDVDLDDSDDDSEEEEEKSEEKIIPQKKGPSFGGATAANSNKRLRKNAESDDERPVKRVKTSEDN